MPTSDIKVRRQLGAAPRLPIPSARHCDMAPEFVQYGKILLCDLWEEIGAPTKMSIESDYVDKKKSMKQLTLERLILYIK